MDNTMTTWNTEILGGTAMCAPAGHALLPTRAPIQGTGVSVGRSDFRARIAGADRVGYTSVVKTSDVAHPRLGAPPV